jgi:inorganic pyrophosphatase
MINKKIRVYIEIEKNSNIKYEFNKENNKLEIDRILDPPFVYPYAYGFIPNTLAMDGDDLDILIITDKNLKNDNFYDVYIIGVLIMEDEKGMDEKVLCVLEEDYININNIYNLDNETILNNDLQEYFLNKTKSLPQEKYKIIANHYYIQ